MNSAFIDRLGWTLVHFLWQGAMLAAMLGIGLLVTRRKSATLRYGLSCAAMFLVALCPLATYTALSPHESSIFSPAAGAAPILQAEPASVNHFVLPAVHPTPEPYNLDKYLPAFVLIWVIGVAVLTIRLIGGLIQIERLKRKHSSAVSPEWQARLDSLAKRLGYLRPVRLLESAKIDVPVAMGVLRSVIILPCSVTLRLPSQEIEAILLHELAHLRRHDYLVNIVQTVIETALFYHPAVWWISRVVRIERENCCDDIAVSASASPFVYARALTALEEVRGSTPTLSMSVKGGLLMSRINRILGIANPSVFRPRVWPSLALLVSLTTILGVMVQTSAESKAPVAKPVKTKSRTWTAKTHQTASKPAKAAAKQAPKSLKPTDFDFYVWDGAHYVPAKSGTVKADAATMQDWLNPTDLDLGKTSHPVISPSAVANAKRAAGAKPATLTKLNAHQEAPAQVKSTVEADLLDANFASAIQAVARQTGMSFVISPDKFPKVSVKVSNMPVVEAINAICFAGNASWRKQGDIYYFEQRKDGQDTVTDRITLHLTDVPLGEAVSRVASLLGARIVLTDGENILTRNIDLKNAPIEQAMWQLAAWAGHPGKWHCENGIYTISAN